MNGSILRLAVLGVACASCSPPPVAPVVVAKLPPPPPASPAAAPASLPAPGFSSQETETAARLVAATIDAPLRFLADDLLEGRAPGTRGDAVAIQYLAAEMEALGLEPGVTDGATRTFLQKVPLVGITADLPKSETFVSKTGRLTLDIARDLVVDAGLPEPKIALDAKDVVFVGYGIVAPEYRWDDYKGVDVKGKVVLVMNNDPENDPALFAGKTRLWYGRWDYKYLEAARHGAAAAIIIHTTASAAYPWHVVVSSNVRERFELPRAPGESRLLAKMWATEDACKRLAALGGQDLDALRARAESRDFLPVPLGIKTTLSLTTRIRTIETDNVVGLLPGTDPLLSKEAIVYSAHHDHLGIGEPKITKGGAAPDPIYNGAVDDASGLATVLAIARAATLGAPTKRSRVFLAVAAEEPGLLGSEWYAKHPTFPAGRIAADINVDWANVRGKTSDVALSGLGRSTLDGFVIAVASAQGRTVHGDPHPEKGFAYRSDQQSFAKIGVPFVYLRGPLSFVGRPAGWGEEQERLYDAERYHQPSDEYSALWDLEGAVEDARLLLITGMRIANDAVLPSWTPRDEFEAARKTAVAAAGAADATAR